MTVDSAPTEAIVSPDTVTPPANWVRVLAPMVIDVAVPTDRGQLSVRRRTGGPGPPTPGAAPVDPTWWRSRWSPRWLPARWPRS
jgi:hypothetical protein